MEKETASLVGPIVTFVGGIIGSVITAYTTIYVARLKDGKTDAAEKKPESLGPRGEMPSRVKIQEYPFQVPQPKPPLQLRIAGTGPHLDAWGTASALTIIAAPFVLGAEYYVLDSYHPDDSFAVTWTVVTGLFLLMLSIILSLSSKGFVDSQKNGK